MGHRVAGQYDRCLACIRPCRCPRAWDKVTEDVFHARVIGGQLILDGATAALRRVGSGFEIPQRLVVCCVDAGHSARSPGSRRAPKLKAKWRSRVQIGLFLGAIFRLTRSHTIFLGKDRRATGDPFVPEQRMKSLSPYVRATTSEPQFTQHIYYVLSHPLAADEKRNSCSMA